MDSEFHLRHNFADSERLANALADDVSANLIRAIEVRGEAVLALSGGSTPKRFFNVLASRDVAWAKVTLTLVDERWVPANDDRSNEKLVRDTLMQGEAANAHFVGLYLNSETPDQAIARLSTMIPKIIDVAVLGMGADGHTASFFPGGDNLAAATSANNPNTVSSMRARGAGEPRITLTLSKLLSAGSIYLHLEGQKKADVLSAAFNAGPVDDLPIRAMIHQNQRPITIFWAP